MSTQAPPQDKALELLKSAFSEDADFRSGQWDAIEKLLAPGARLLVVERTGWGKSVVYFVAARLLRESGKGMSILISPLLALMRNQLDMARKFGLRAATINSSNEDEWPDIEAAVADNRLDVLFISPERLANPKFKEWLKPVLIERTGLLVVDEAHCVSEWGHDFRPDYRRIPEWVRGMPTSASVLMTTATATERVIEDLKQLFGGLDVQRGSLIRESLRLSCFELPDHSHRLAWLGKFIPRFPGSGIVYCQTIHDCEQVADFLKTKGVDAAAYHSNLDHEVRLHLEERFRSNEIKALCATTALGMGYDKADVGFVVHYQLPTSLLGYYQQIGRAGRLLDTAFGAMLFGEQDLEIVEHFARTSMPPQGVFDAIICAIREGKSTANEIAAELKKPFSIVLHALNVLEIDDTVKRERENFKLSKPDATFNADHYAALRERKLDEARQVFDYGRAKECRMQKVARALGDDQAQPCGKCDNCKPHAALVLEPELIREAENYLKSTYYEIAVRARLPLGTNLVKSSVIPPEHRTEPGLALAAYNDAGWGKLVRAAKYGGKGFPEELVLAAADLIRQSGFNPDWATWVPSESNHKVRDFAALLCAELKIHCFEAIVKAKENAPQKSMISSTAQVANVWDAFKVIQTKPGKCLLIDDIVDSGWTLTILGMRLREQGSGPVMPFALASARPRRAQR